ncbi:uncharacterized protein LOC119694260 [Plutella xylostella]|uniref:uncharacterized protein LOC119694260 n=1 Tax=Plutella xylostella TaxID=51655 RepID=UPI002032241C|nr:uncharacterized protein LOC119694260 [Plutella xylostella]
MESCVQEYFQQRVQCTPAFLESGAVKFDTITMKIPSTKMIIDQLNTTIDEVDGKIVAFTVNEEKKLAVLAVEFTNLTMNSNLLFNFYGTGKEPITFTGALDEFFPSIVMTSFFSTETYDLHTARHFAYLPAVPTVALTGGCLDTDDEVLSEALADFNENFNTVLLEGWRSVGVPLANYYIQNHICDYGIKY